MSMKKMPDRDADYEMRAEYDFRGGVRGKYAERYARGTQLTIVVQPDSGEFVSLCPELDIASQGDTVEEARANLIEAVNLFLDTADESEIKRRKER
jgi:predicted RNase H-like HicB family nuclease